MASEWYYEIDGDRQGPVSSAALKQLAMSGKIRPKTLVWKDGMTQWSQAKSLKGLFADGQMASPVSPSPQPKPAPRPQVSHSSVWHPLDLVVDLVRNACPSDLAATISKIAGQVGVYILYAAAALSPVAGLLIATKTGAFLPLVASLALGVCLLVEQYIAGRLLGACDAAIRANKTVLSSLAVPDCFFVASSVGTILGVIALIGTAISTSEFNLVIAAIALLVVGAFTAMVAIDPAGVAVVVNPECRAGEEAVGVLTFLMKVFLRCAPIAFAASVTYATWGLISFLWRILRVPEEMLPFLVTTGSALTAGMLTAAAAIPLYAFLLMLVYNLSLDVLSAVVSIPAKLDTLADVARPSSDAGS